jgi:hypothetical protein
MTEFIGTAVDSITTSRPAMRVRACSDAGYQGVSDSCAAMRLVHCQFQGDCTADVTSCVATNQVGILQFSNEVRVEMPPKAVDKDAFQSKLQTMVRVTGASLAVRRDTCTAICVVQADCALGLCSLPHCLQGAYPLADNILPAPCRRV